MAPTATLRYARVGQVGWTLWRPSRVLGYIEQYGWPSTVHSNRYVAIGVLRNFRVSVGKAGGNRGSQAGQKDQSPKAGLVLHVEAGGQGLLPEYLGAKMPRQDAPL